MIYPVTLNEQTTEKLADSNSNNAKATKKQNKLQRYKRKITKHQQTATTAKKGDRTECRRAHQRDEPTIFHGKSMATTIVLHSPLLLLSCKFVAFYFHQVD